MPFRLRSLQRDLPIEQTQLYIGKENLRINHSQGPESTGEYRNTPRRTKQTTNSLQNTHPFHSISCQAGKTDQEFYKFLIMYMDASPPPFLKSLQRKQAVIKKKANHAFCGPQKTTSEMSVNNKKCWFIIKKSFRNFKSPKMAFT